MEKRYFMQMGEKKAGLAILAFTNISDKMDFKTKAVRQGYYMFSEFFKR